MLYKFLQFLNESDFNKIIFTTDILYRIDLCTAILKLQESGVIDEYKTNSGKRNETVICATYLFSHYTHVVLWPELSRLNQKLHNYSPKYIR